MRTAMVFNLLRSFRTPLICVLGTVSLFLLLHLANQKPHPMDVEIRTPLPSPFRRKAAAASPPQQSAEFHGVPGEKEPDLESLLRANEDENWAQGADCAPYPRYENLNYHSPYFQLTKEGNLSYYLYGAYYDRRPQVPEVMILAMVTTVLGPYPPAYCQMWYDGDTQPELVPVHETKLGWYAAWGAIDGLAYPTMMTCRIASTKRRIPQLVSLVFNTPCAVAQNALKVVQPPAEERIRYRLRTGVCVKYLRFPDVDMSERFVEWLELMRLLGAIKVTAYDIGELKENTSRTLKHYTAPEDGLLELRDYRLLDEIEGHDQFRTILNEVLLYNDCLYRNMYDLDYIAVIDVDEVIMPLGQYRNWPDLLAELTARDVECTARSSYCFRNVYFPKELPVDPGMPSHFYMLSHLTRVADHLDPNLAAKCLHNTEQVTLLHNHFPMAWRSACNPQDVPVTLGQMQHYRHVDDEKTLKEPPPKKDTNIRRFRQQLIRNSMKVHRQLGWS